METILNFLKTEYTFSLSGTLLTIMAILLFSGVIGVLMLIVNLYKKLKFAETPKYGFLGKPLYQMAVLGVLSLGVVFTIYNASQPQDLEDTSAKEELTVEVTTREVATGVYEFNVTPKVNSFAWGRDPGRKFNIYINATGPASFNEFLYDKNEFTEAKFTKQLPRGTYNLTITVVSEDSTYTFSQTLTL